VVGVEGDVEWLCYIWGGLNFKGGCLIGLGYMGVVMMGRG
jgi:hypothetical protein